jgi:hypothetical protein
MTAIGVSPILRLTLPRATALTDFLLAPTGETIGDGELASARDRIQRLLPVATRGRRESGAVRIDAYRIQVALNSPARLASDNQIFSPSPAACRRAIGVAAIRMCVRDRSLSPARAVAIVLDRATTPEVEAGGGPWWREWFRRIPLGARSVAESEAVTWATQLQESLEWERFDPLPRIGGDYRWQCDGSARVMLHGKVDVEARVGDRPVFFLLQTGIAGPQWMAALALSALAAGLARGSASLPARVVALWPASGQVRMLEVEPGTLDRASNFAIEAARLIAR